MNKKLPSIIKSLPKKTGVYLFKDKTEQILYIGKAINLKKRVQSHFVKTNNNTDIEFIVLPDIPLEKDIKDMGCGIYYPKYQFRWVSFRGNTKIFNIEFNYKVNDFIGIGSLIKWVNEDFTFIRNDKSLTIGHPQVGQVNLEKSFSTTNYKDIWVKLEQHLNVYSIKTSDAYTEYNYNWSDVDFMQRQIDIISGK